MPEKSSGTGKSSQGSASLGDGLVSVAHTIGSTLGAAVATAGDAAKDFEHLTRGIRKSAVGATRKVYKRVKKTVSAAAPRRKRASKSRAKKSKSRKSGAKRSGAKSRAKRRSGAAR